MWPPGWSMGRIIRVRQAGKVAVEVSSGIGRRQAMLRVSSVLAGDKEVGHLGYSRKKKSHTLVSGAPNTCL